jgi:hypothetical protein
MMASVIAFLGHPIVVALLTALVMWIAGWVRSYLARRITVQGPEAAEIKRQREVLEKTVSAVNTLIDIKGPELDLLIALGEAAQGKNNGNVTAALTCAREARSTFKGFLGRAACIEVET